jgi:hypothetical protein
MHRKSTEALISAKSVYGAVIEIHPADCGYVASRRRTFEAWNVHSVGLAVDSNTANVKPVVRGT